MAIQSNDEHLPTRRDVLIMGATGLVTLAGFGAGLTGKVFAEAMSSVKSSPALEEGPYWIDETGKAFHRSDIRPNVDGKNVQRGLPLHLALKVSQVHKGVVTPLPNAFVYLWCANALGVYSGEDQEGTAQDTYLRGYQVADKNGLVRFLGLYPGWYGGRTVHIHARIRTYPGANPSNKPIHDFETQLFFDDAISDHVMTKMAPYNERPDRDTVNTNDHVYMGPSLDGTRNSNSGKLMQMRVDTSASHATASLQLVLDLSKHARPGMPPGGFGGPPPEGFGGPPPDGMGGPPPDDAPY